MKIRSIKNKLYKRYPDLYSYMIDITVRLKRPITADDLIDQVIDPRDAESGDHMVWISNYWFPIIDRYPNLWDVCGIEDDHASINIGTYRQNNQLYHLKKDGDEIIEHLSHLDYLDLDIKYTIWYHLTDVEKQIEQL